MSGKTLTIEKVDKIYGEGGPEPVHAVKALDLEVEAGEIVALLGSSGCGKTSTLRMIAGFEEVSAGAIRLGGEPIHMAAPAKRGVAMAFEGYSLYPPLSAEENIAFALGRERLDRAAIAERVREIAHLLEIEPLLTKRPSHLSGGQQQRVSLGRALARNAALHLLDEPMGQLEPQLRAHLRGRLKRFVKDRGLTAILVTHDQTEANALADRIAVMEGGELRQFDAPEALKTRPANLFTGAFIGEPPMNLFPARASSDGATTRFALEGGAELAFASDGFAPELRDRLARAPELVLGVRPHAVALTEGGDDARVESCQWLGDQTHVAAAFAGATLVSAVHRRLTLARGAPVGVAMRVEDLHLFDPVSERAIAHGGRLA